VDPQQNLQGKAQPEQDEPDESVLPVLLQGEHLLARTKAAAQVIHSRVRRVLGWPSVDEELEEGDSPRQG
jgi:hypothetical protein